ncbi:MAG: putative glycoside hydrolase [Herpetosiphon sp.]
MRLRFMSWVITALLVVGCGAQTAGGPAVVTGGATASAAVVPTDRSAVGPSPTSVTSIPVSPTFAPETATDSTTQTAITVSPTARTRIEPTPTGTTIATPTPQRGILGSVSDRATGKPIAQAWVYLNDTMTRTNELGQYTFSGAADNGMLTVLAPGYAKWSAPAPSINGRVELVPFAARAAYLPYGLASQAAQRNRMFDMIKRTALNAVVIDVKSDDGFVWRSGVPLAKQVGASDDTLDLRAFAADAHQRGIYVIGRFTIFKDTVLVRARPELAIHRPDGDIWRDPPGNGYADPFVTTTWQYYADLAKDIAAQGVDEIQYDYIRFPVDGDMKTAQYHSEATGKTRIAAITQFVTFMEQQLRTQKVFISVDIFGRVVWHPVDPDTGQTLEQIAAHVDYVSPMLYPSGFNTGSGGFDRPPEHPYEIIKQSLERTVPRIKGLPVRVRPWLQAFQDYAWNIPYGLAEYLGQRQAADELGTSGWMYWNPLGRYDERTFAANP